MVYEDFDDDEFDGGASSDESFDDSEQDVVPCPECRADVFDDAEQCPNCGAYIVHDHSVWSGRPGWWIVLGLLGIAMVILTLVCSSLALPV